jgi:hypothetical protein
LLQLAPEVETGKIALESVLEVIVVGLCLLLVEEVLVVEDCYF